MFWFFVFLFWLALLFAYEVGDILSALADMIRKKSGGV